MKRIFVACVTLATMFGGCASTSPQPPVAPPEPGAAPAPTHGPPSTIPPGESLTTEDVKLCTDPRDPELQSYFRKLHPRRGFYFFKLLRTKADVTIVVVRASEDLSAKRAKSPVPLPAVEQIIGPIRRSDVKAWHLVYALLRRYSSSPPAANYCWEDDCYGAFNPLLDHNQGDFPYPGQDPPGQPPTGGYMVAPDPSGDPTASLEPEIDTVQLALGGRPNPTMRYLVDPDPAPAPAPPRKTACVDEKRLAVIKGQAAEIAKIGSTPTGGSTSK